MRKLIPLLLCLLLAASSTLSSAANTQDSSQAFAVRGLHIDFRTQVMTMDALRALADKMAAAGMNTLLMEWEATIPFERNATISNKLAFSPKEIKDFVAYCNSLGIDVIPLQNCFGHCQYILRHERYRDLREDSRDFAQVCPLSGKDAEDVFRSIFQDVIDLHTSQYVHIGADETRSLGHCDKCAEYVSKHGTSELFVQYVARMCKIVSELGKTPIIWGDILAKYPEALDKLPKDLVIMEWNYGWDLKRFGDIEKIVDAGLKVWGSPALRSSPDNLYLAMWDKHLGNLENYVEFCKKKKFCGLIETSWSTSGGYGYIFDNENRDVNAIQPMREVYPMVAYDIMEQAFFESCKKEPFDGHKFVRRYAGEHYGFTGKDVDTFERYFYTAQHSISKEYFTTEALKKELSTFIQLRKDFAALKPNAHKDEFRHLIFMLDIRINYLKFQNINVQYESKDFKSSGKKALAEELKPVLKEAYGIQKQFIKLNSSFLKDPSASFGDWSYLFRMQAIYDSLTK